MKLTAPKKLSYDELSALNLRLMKELETAYETIAQNYSSVQIAIDSERRSVEFAKERKDEVEEKKSSYALYRLQGLFSEYNDLPTRMADLRLFLVKARDSWEETAVEQWVRVQKFLLATDTSPLGHESPYPRSRDMPRSYLEHRSSVDKLEEDVFNETRLYEALGKDDARLILAFWRDFQEVRLLRRKIDTEDHVSGPKIDPHEVMFRFRETDLFQEMSRLLEWAREVLPLTKLDPEKKPAKEEIMVRRAKWKDNCLKHMDAFFEKVTMLGVTLIRPGEVVQKKSHKPFKSGSKTNTVKALVPHSVTGRLALTFEEDDSEVEAFMCEVVPKKENAK